MRVFPGKVNFGTSSLSKADCPPQCASSNLLAWREQKGEGRENWLYLYLTAWAGTSAQGLEFTPLALLARPLGSDWTTPSPVLGFQLTHGRSWDFSASIITQANLYSKSLYLLVLSLCRTLTNTQDQIKKAFRLARTHWMQEHQNMSDHRQYR